MCRVLKDYGPCSSFYASVGRYSCVQPQLGAGSLPPDMTVSAALRGPRIPCVTIAFEMSFTIAIAQVNPTVGDVAGNLALVRRARDEAAALGADLVVFPELVLVGYPPEDLVLRPALVEAAAQALEALERESTSGPALVVTLPWRGRRLPSQRCSARRGRPDGSCDSNTSCPITASSTKSACSLPARCDSR